MRIRQYLIACNSNIKSGKLKRAKKAFDLAWNEYTKGNYDDTDEKYLFWLRGNFYRTDRVVFNEESYYIEGKILAAAGL